MLRFLGRRWAKINYIFRQEKEAATNELLSKLALRTAGEHRDLAAKLSADADTMDARIKEVAEMEEEGFWVCENGHEDSSTKPPFRECEECRSKPGSPILCSDCLKRRDEVAQTAPFRCHNCGKPGEFIKRDQMSGQEKYESDKERGEAQKMADQKRAQAKAADEDAANSEKTARYFRDLAESNRTVADRVRRL